MSNGGFTFELGSKLQKFGLLSFEKMNGENRPLMTNGLVEFEK